MPPIRTVDLPTYHREDVIADGRFYGTLTSEPHTVSVPEP